MRTTDMNIAKTWLESITFTEEEIQALCDEQKRLLSRGLVSAPFSFDKARGDKQCGNAEHFTDYAKYSDEISARVRELVKLKCDIRKAIDEIQHPVYRILLQEHYINGKNFTAISTRLGKSYDHVVHNLHPSALRAVKVPEKYVKIYK